jgi:hypothetical protein
MRVLLFSFVAALAFGQGPQITPDNRLIPPADYREWIFLSSGLGMTYSSETSNPANPLFDDVFVNPPAYREFMKTGKWPEGTIFVLEVRNSSSRESINQGGHFQAGINHRSAEVKDSRFKEGWAFFPLSDSGEPSKELPQSAGCQACHGKNGAVENTFVQFYPTLLPVAKAHGTLKASAHQ